MVLVPFPQLNLFLKCTVGLCDLIDLSTKSLNFPHCFLILNLKRHLFSINSDTLATWGIIGMPVAPVSSIMLTLNKLFPETVYLFLSSFNDLKWLLFLLFVPSSFFFMDFTIFLLKLQTTFQLFHAPFHLIYLLCLVSNDSILTLVLTFQPS